MTMPKFLIRLTFKSLHSFNMYFSFYFDIGSFTLTFCYFMSPKNIKLLLKKTCIKEEVY